MRRVWLAVPVLGVLGLAAGSGLHFRERLQEVDGIGPKTYADIAPNVRV